MAHCWMSDADVVVVVAHIWFAMRRRQSTHPHSLMSVGSVGMVVIPFGCWLLFSTGWQMM